MRRTRFAEGRRRHPRDPRPLLRRHWPFLVVLLAGAVVRAVCLVAYHPALLFNGDSYVYLHTAQHLQPPIARPVGYPVLLHLASPFHRLVLVPTVQHLLGLGLGVALYTLLLRRGAARWLAVLAAAPVLLDAYQIDIEQFVMAETVFEVLLVAALVVLLRRRSPSVAACAVVGLLLAAATLTRTVALAVVILVAGYLIVRRLGPRRLGAFLVAVALPLVGYASWFHHVHGAYALEQFDGRFLWGRVEPFADCSKLALTPQQRVLCDSTPRARRGGPNDYLYGSKSPLRRLRLPDRSADHVAKSFAYQTIRRQPGDYAAVVAGDVTHYFAPGRSVRRGDWFNGTWVFPSPDRPVYWHVNYADKGLRLEKLPEQHPSPRLVGLLRGYQRVVYTPGPLLFAAVLVALAGALWQPGLLRRRRGTPAERRARRTHGRSDTRDRWDTLLLVSAGLAMLVLPAASTSFDFRYLLPTLLLLPPAAALGWLQFVASRQRDREATAEPGPSGRPAESRRAGRSRSRHRRRRAGSGPSRSSR